jgi:hypothetical protein
MMMMTKSEHQTKDFTSHGFKHGVLTVFFVLLGPIAQCAREMRLQLLNPIDLNKLLHTIKLNPIDLNELLHIIDHFYLNIARNGSTQRKTALLLPPQQYPVDHGLTMSHLMTIYHSFWRMSSTAIAVHLIPADLSIAADCDLGWHPH